MPIYFSLCQIGIYPQPINPSFTPAMKQPKERRQHQRYIPHEELMAFNSSNFGQVINISAGGLLYKSLLIQGETEANPPQIGLLNSAEGHFIDQLPCRVVNIKNSLPLLPSSNTIIREASIEFLELTLEQQDHLHDFLKKNTVGLA